MISFIVPAHNEQAFLGRTLQAIHESARCVGRPYEIIVVDDASTDATAEIARDNQARVVRVNHRHIAATRNSGAREASGGGLFFVDADTTINPRAVAAALRAMDKGAAGGGAPVRFDRAAPLYTRILLWWISWFMRVAGITGGACMFCTREAFNLVGGFDERLFGAEDAVMAWALQREGRFVVLWQHVLTSGRRVRGIRGLRMLTALIRMAFFPKMLTRRSRVEKIWYQPTREHDLNATDSPATQVFNVIMLLLTILLLSGPFWGLIPWSLTPSASVPGKIRLGVAVLQCHLGLMLWPCAYFLLRYLFQQKRWLTRMKLAAMIALCLWGAWGATPVVIWFWPWLYHCMV
jgi:glycosyltransferase involved in cell wall biosynthesis